ncbi:MAG: tetratricopeptide repeat protein [Phycisphaerales bacterium]
MQTCLTCSFSVLVAIISTATGCASPTTGAPGGQRPFVDAETASAYLLEAEAAFASGDLLQTERNLALALEADPFDGRLHYNLGVLALRRGEYDAALSGFERAMQLLPQAVEPQLGIAATLLQTGRHSLAADVFQQALELDPSNTIASEGLALAVELTGAHEGSNPSPR